MEHRSASVEGIDICFFYLDHDLDHSELARITLFNSPPKKKNIRESEIVSLKKVYK